MTGKLRYFGVTLDEKSQAGTRTDPKLGQFVTLTEPMPVGSTVELDGSLHVVTRVDEGTEPGFWLWAGGSVPRAESAVPRDIDDVPTAPTPPPTQDAAVPQVIEDDRTVGGPPTDEAKPDDGTKRKRRRGAKTVIGR